MTDFATRPSDPFLGAICVGLQVMTGFDQGVMWAELVRAAGVDDLLHYATFVEPDEWVMAGFAKYARAELGRGRPRKPRAIAAPQAPIGYLCRHVASVRDAEKHMPGDDTSYLWRYTHGTKHLERFEGYEHLEVMRLFAAPQAAK